MKNYMKVTFLSKNENVIFSRTVAVGFLVNLNLEISILNEIKTAISEAVTNAIVHGYENNENKGFKRVTQEEIAEDTSSILIENEAEKRVLPLRYPSRKFRFRLYFQMHRT